jgi:hypothetical protein
LAHDFFKRLSDRTKTALPVQLVVVEELYRRLWDAEGVKKTSHVGKICKERGFSNVV